MLEFYENMKFIFLPESVEVKPFEKVSVSKDFINQTYFIKTNWLLNYYYYLCARIKNNYTLWVKYPHTLH